MDRLIDLNKNLYENVAKTTAEGTATNHQPVSSEKVDPSLRILRLTPKHPISTTETTQIKASNDNKHLQTNCP